MHTYCDHKLFMVHTDAPPMDRVWHALARVYGAGLRPTIFEGGKHYQLAASVLPSIRLGLLLCVQRAAVCSELRANRCGLLACVQPCSRC